MNKYIKLTAISILAGLVLTAASFVITADGPNSIECPAAFNGGLSANKELGSDGGTPQQQHGFPREYYTSAMSANAPCYNPVTLKRTIPSSFERTNFAIDVLSWSAVSLIFIGMISVLKKREKKSDGLS